MRRVLLTHLFIERNWEKKCQKSEETLKAIHEVLEGCCLSSSLEPQQKEPNCSRIHVGTSEAHGGAMMGWEQLLVFCIYLTPPPFNSSVYPLEKKCVLLLLFYSQKPLLLVSLSRAV